jgi:hypothetical protein
MTELDLFMSGVISLVVLGAIFGVVFGTAWSFASFMAKHAGKFVILAIVIVLLNYFG